jgi:hypothetical protein
MTPECQAWAFEVHPEVCFWVLNGERPAQESGARPEPFGRDEGPVAVQLCGQTQLVRALVGAWPETLNPLGKSGDRIQAA